MKPAEHPRLKFPSGGRERDVAIPLDVETVLVIDAHFTKRMLFLAST
jgi:hypothetical protein